MKLKKILKVLPCLLLIIMLFPQTVMAHTNRASKGTEEEIQVPREEFENLVLQVEKVKLEHPEASDDEIITIMDEHFEKTKGIMDIWNQLTDSEKKLVIQHPLSALKVNDAKNYAIESTISRFGKNGLGDRSDAFRHGIWNAKMTKDIGYDLAEQFATAHEDKEVSGSESDGYLKEQHKEMDLHNNNVGRNIGQDNLEILDDELASIIYKEIMKENSLFVWLHE